MTAFQSTFIQLFTNTVTVSLAIGAHCLITLAVFARFGKKIAARSRFFIWLILLCRLAVPISFLHLPAIWEIRLPALTETSGTTLRETPAQPEPTVPPASSDEKFATSERGDSWDSWISSDSLVSSPAAPPTDRDPAETDQTIGSNLPTVSYQEENSSDSAAEQHLTFFGRFVTVAAAVFAIGAAAYLAFQLLSYLLFCYDCRRFRMPITESEILKTYASCCQRLGLRHPPKLYRSPTADSPMLYGYFSPAILLPAHSDLPCSEAILLHELIHYRRKDLFFKLLLAVIRALHWWNPVIHLAVSQCEQCIELACDDAVLKDQTTNVRISYGKTMLNTAKWQEEQRRSFRRR